MYSLFKSDVYRLIHGKMLWVCLGIVAVSIISTGAAIWFMSSEAFRTMMMNAAGGSGQTGTVTGGAALATSSKVEVNSLSFFTAQSVLSGGIMGLLLGLISSLLMASDFETGFAKGIFSAQRNRLIYYAEKLILLFVLCIAAIIISLIISLVIAGIFGITFAHPDNVGNLLLWVLLMGLLQFIYASVAALLVWFMRSKAAGVLCAALVGSHVVGVLVIQILRAVFPSQAMTNALSWLPLSCIQTAIVGSSVVAQAAVEGAIAPGIHIALTGLIGSAIIIAVSLTFAPRKDI